MHVETINLSDGAELELGSFNVIIGGNAVGKTTLLFELYAKLCDAGRARWHWIKDISTVSANPQRDAAQLFNSLARQ
jgi:ABC-type cobalamin/Fe3+-siderophores transport system ATPase subunit